MFLGPLAAFIFAFVLGFTGPASSGMVELTVKTVKKASDNSAIPAENTKGKSKTVEQCAKNFHQQLGEIRTAHLPKLDEAYTQAKGINSSMPGEMIFKPRRPPRKTLEGKLVRRAITNASVRGHRGVLSNDGLNWLTRQIVANLKTYLGQPYKPFICTGSQAFLNFVSPHIIKVADLGSTQARPWQDYQAFVNQELVFAWRALSPISLPIWAAERPSQRVSESIGSIRPTINSQTTFNVEISEAGPTSQPDAADSDLPRMNETNFGITINGQTDIRPAIEKLLDRATSNGYLVPKPNKGPTNTTTQNANPLPDAIAALQEARGVLNSNKFTPITGTRGNPLIRAFSKLETYFYLFPNNNDPMVKLATAMQDTLDAIKRASIQSCTCTK